MGCVMLDMAMSLDGFVAGPGDTDGGLHNWFFTPDAVSRAVIHGSIQSTGALIMGRRTYNIGDQYGGFVDDPYPVPHFVITHQVPQTRAAGAERFIFVTDGIASALRQARAAAGDKNIVIGGGASIARQFLRAGLVDVLQIHLIPALLGDGTRLFADLPHTELAVTRVIEAASVTHLTYQVWKAG